MKEQLGGGGIPLAPGQPRQFTIQQSGDVRPVLRYPLLGGRLDKADARPCIVVAAPTKNCGFI